MFLLSHSGALHNTYRKTPGGKCGHKCGQHGAVWIDWRLQECVQRQSSLSKLIIRQLCSRQTSMQDVVWELQGKGPEFAFFLGRPMAIPRCQAIDKPYMIMYHSNLHILYIQTQFSLHCIDLQTWNFGVCTCFFCFWRKWPTAFGFLPSIYSHNVW